MNFTAGGGSSSVFSSALKACGREHVDLVQDDDLEARPGPGGSAAASRSSRTSSTLLLLAASSSTTSGWRSARMARHSGQTPQGSGVGPPVPSGPTQFSARAMMRAVVVLPTPRTPVSMKACGDAALGEGVAQGADQRVLADQLGEGGGAVLAGEHAVGRAVGRAAAGRGRRAAAAAVAASPSPNRPGPSAGGGSGRPSSRGWSSSAASPVPNRVLAMPARRTSKAGWGWKAGEATRARTRCGCFLPDLTGLARRPSVTGLPIWTISCLGRRGARREGHPGRRLAAVRFEGIAGAPSAFGQIAGVAAGDGWTPCGFPPAACPWVWTNRRGRRGLRRMPDGLSSGRCVHSDKSQEL